MKKSNGRRMSSRTYYDSADDENDDDDDDGKAGRVYGRNPPEGLKGWMRIEHAFDLQVVIPLPLLSSSSGMFLHSLPNIIPSCSSSSIP